MWIHLARLTRVASIHFLSQLFTSTIYAAVRARVSVCVSVCECEREIQGAAAG